MNIPYNTGKVKIGTAFNRSKMPEVDEFLQQALLAKQTHSKPKRFFFWRKKMTDPKNPTPSILEKNHNALTDLIFQAHKAGWLTGFAAAQNGWEKAYSSLEEAAQDCAETYLLKHQKQLEQQEAKV